MWRPAQAQQAQPASSSHSSGTLNQIPQSPAHSSYQTQQQTQQQQTKGLAAWRHSVSDVVQRETVFLRELSTLREYFVEPLSSRVLRKQLGVKKKHVSDIFGVVNHLWTIHIDLYHDLAAALAIVDDEAGLSPADVQIAAQIVAAAAAFAKLGSLLISSYSGYPERLRVSRQRLRELTAAESSSRSANFAAFIQSQEETMRRQHSDESLDTLLARPLDRCAMYVDFLDRARRHSEICCCDAAGKASREANQHTRVPEGTILGPACEDSCTNKRCKVCNAFARVVVAQAQADSHKAGRVLGNSTDGRALNFQAMQELQARLVGDIDINSPQRRLIVEACFELAGASAGARTFCFALFNDSLLIAEYPKKAKKGSKMDFRRFVPLSVVRAYADTAEVFVIDAFGWQYRCKNDSEAPAFLQAVNQKKAAAAEKNPERKPSLRLALTRDRALALLESSTRISEPPRLVCKVQCRWSATEQRYRYDEGFHETGNRYQIGKSGAIFGRDVDFDATDSFTRVLITSDDGVSRRNRHRLGHAQVWYDENLGAFMLKDSGSTGGTFVSTPGGEMREHLRSDSAPVQLLENSVFQMGQTQFVVLLIETPDNVHTPRGSASGRNTVVPGTSAAANLDTFEFSAPPFGDIPPGTSPANASPYGAIPFVSAAVRGTQLRHNDSYGEMPVMAPTVRGPVRAEGNNAREATPYGQMPNINRR